MKRYSEKTIVNILKRMKDGESAYSLSTQTGISSQVIYYWAKKTGVKAKKPTNWNKIKNLVEENK